MEKWLPWVIVGAIVILYLNHKSAKATGKNSVSIQSALVNATPITHIITKTPSEPLQKPIIKNNYFTNVLPARLAAAKTTIAKATAPIVKPIATTPLKIGVAGTSNPTQCYAGYKPIDPRTTLKNVGNPVCGFCHILGEASPTAPANCCAANRNVSGRTCYCRIAAASVGGCGPSERCLALGYGGGVYCFNTIQQICIGASMLGGGV